MTLGFVKMTLGFVEMTLGFVETWRVSSKRDAFRQNAVSFVKT